MKKYALEMTTTEVKPITAKITELQSGETVTGATVTHIPPSGSPVEIGDTLDAPYVNFLLGPLAVTGIHLVKVQGTGSAGSKPEILYSILVKI